MDKKLAIDADDLIHAMSWSFDLMGAVAAGTSTRKPATCR